MEKENLINEIDQISESIKSHIDRIKNEHFQTHKLDVDVLIEKTRKLYDTLINLDALSVSFDIEMAENKVQEVEEVTEKEEIKRPDDHAEEKENTVQEAIEKEPMEAPEQLEEEVEVQQDELDEDISAGKPGIEIEQPKNAAPEETEFHIKSTIDLFSTASEPSIGDRLKTGESPTIADKMTKDAINELRKAIGINEKFQFINELFNGDMNRYNKIIDELDQLPTLEGVNTYLLELKIQHQWADENPALIKLNDLLQRKFKR